MIDRDRLQAKLSKMSTLAIWEEIKFWILSAEWWKTSLEFYSKHQCTSDHQDFCVNAIADDLETAEIMQEHLIQRFCRERLSVSNPNTSVPMSTD